MPTQSNGALDNAYTLTEHLLSLRPQDKTSSTYEGSLVDDYSSDDEESAPALKKKAGRPKKVGGGVFVHAHCLSNHRQSTCLDERCKDVFRCHHQCQGCPDIPENKKKKEQLKKEKEKEKNERALSLKAKKIEKYGKMLADAEAYKAKWNL